MEVHYINNLFNLESLRNNVFSFHVILDYNYVTKKLSIDQLPKVAVIFQNTLSANLSVESELLYAKSISLLVLTEKLAAMFM
jgi:hypothetical protein